MLRRGGLNLAVFHQFVDYLVHDTATFFDVRHFPAAKDHSNLDFVLVLKELHGPFDFEFNVVLACFWSKANLFRLHLVSTVPGPLFLLVLVFAEIHDATNRRLFGWRHLDQIKSRLACFLQCLAGGNDPQLLTSLRDDPYWSNTDLLVDPVLDAFDRDCPFTLKERRNETGPAPAIARTRQNQKNGKSLT